MVIFRCVGDLEGKLRCRGCANSSVATGRCRLRWRGILKALSIPRDRGCAALLVGGAAVRGSDNAVLLQRVAFAPGDAINRVLVVLKLFQCVQGAAPWLVANQFIHLVERPLQPARTKLSRYITQGRRWGTLHIHIVPHLFGLACHEMVLGAIQGHGCPDALKASATTDV